MHHTIPDTPLQVSKASLLLLCHLAYLLSIHCSFQLGALARYMHTCPALCRSSVNNQLLPSILSTPRACIRHFHEHFRRRSRLRISGSIALPILPILRRCECLPSAEPKTALRRARGRDTGTITGGLCTYSRLHTVGAVAQRRPRGAKRW
ncbi:hypothetical protein EDC01DRAFT_461150 [Geopyxis carbonaria]|nr:hypothetical protein EDC01DRAFT_461150 [Geopyxis carbonaria]